MSILEFDDGIGGRLRGTLHAPGATPGDVLTVGATRGAISPSPGGGSQPVGTVQSADYLFTEVATAGVYTAPALDLPEKAYLVDAQWFLTGDQADWAADTAVLDVVDTAVGTIIGAQDVKGAGGLVVSAAQTNVLTQPYVFPNLTGNPEPAGGGTVTVTITTTIAVPPVAPAAVMIVRVFYVVPPTPVAAVFA